MKRLLIPALLLLAPARILAESLPVISAQPQNLVGSGTFSVVSANATGFQWRCNGVDIPGATNSTLSRSNADPSGYYLVVGKNGAGWAPSSLAYLARGSGGYVPFSNYGNPDRRARAISLSTGLPLIAGLAQVVAGPELDQMQPVGDTWDFSWYDYDPSMAGYFDMDNQLVPDVSPGQIVYYRVDLTYPGGSGVAHNPSRTFKLIAGGGSYPTPSVAGALYPGWPEWPEPWYMDFSSAPTNLVCVPGETVSLTDHFAAYTDFGIPTAQWRKDGAIMSGATNFIPQCDPYWQCFSWYSTITITNVQAADAGVYDLEVFGNQWVVTPKIALSVQLTNVPALFQSPRLSDTNFVFDLLGVPGRKYSIDWSADLLLWNPLSTTTNVTGTVTVTNPFTADNTRYYRARLLP
jgi:hypothetical protein